MKLMSSQNKTRRHPYWERKYLHVQEQRNKPKKWSNVDALRAKTRKPSQDGDERQKEKHKLIPIMQHRQILNVLTPREKVQKVLHLFRIIFEELERDKAAHGATNKTHLDAHAIIKREGRQFNGEKMVGVIPGVDVEDEFLYKAELSLIGLHFNLSGGIDNMNKNGVVLATSVVASEGSGYNNIFDNDVIIYSGEGMCLKSKNPKVIEDQKMIEGNLALANSRGISGRKGMEHKEKQYTYEGLYLVEKFLNEQGPLGNNVFKFQLRRLPGQPSID